MINKKEWIKCSAVAIGFYMIVYILLAHFFFGFLNPWLILITMALLAGDVWGLHWFIQRYGGSEDDPYP